MPRLSVEQVRHKANRLREGDQISDHGRRAAADKRRTTAGAIAEAKRSIERDVEKNFGIYPYNSGSVTAAEVLRRAGLDVRLLAKPRHRELRDHVNLWVKNVQGRTLRGAAVIRRAVTEGRDVARAELDAIRQQWAEAELEFVEAEAALQSVRTKCAVLEDENARLRGLLSGTNVIPILPNSR